MKNLTYIFVTVLAVSIDSFFAGISIHAKKNKKFKATFFASIIILLMCVVGNVLGNIFKSNLAQNLSYIGGVILFTTGLISMIKITPDGFCFIKPIGDNITEYLIIGFGVGIDGCIANFSLSIMGYTSLLISFFTALLHAVLIFLGITLRNCINNKNTLLSQYISPIILITLGLYKIIFSF